MEGLKIKETGSLAVEYIALRSLKPYEKNTKLHPKKQVEQIANSIKNLGFINPIVTDEKGVIVAGHGRYEAAKFLKLKKVPVVSVNHLTEEELRLYRLADNQLTLNSGYDDSLLKIELEELLSLDLSLDIGITGFETSQIDLIIDSSPATENDPADDIPQTQNGELVTKLGDIWQLGKHKLICGDALNGETYQQLLGEEKADMVFTDPPYNVKVDGHICGSGKIKHREFEMASGEMSEAEFTEFLTKFIKLAINFTSDGSIHYVCMDWRHMFELLTAGKTYTELKNICVWSKNNGGMGSLYRSQHEMVSVFKNGKLPHINNVQLGKHGRYRTNIWEYAGVNSFGRNRKDLELHPTVKPVAMVADAIKDCTNRGQLVLDPFAGSGSTLIAAEKSGRIARCVELDPAYCDVIIRRWQKTTDKDALNLASSSSFNELSGDSDV